MKEEKEKDEKENKKQKGRGEGVSTEGPRNQQTTWVRPVFSELIL